MSYIDGFVVAVPSEKKADYERVARTAAKVFHEYGATRVVECWGEEVPAGEVTDFRRAVQAKDGETIVFSWVEWPSRELHDEVSEKLMKDPRMQMGSDMPFDGKRMIYGGFEALLDTGEERDGHEASAQEAEPARH